MGPPLDSVMTWQQTYLFNISPIGPIDFPHIDKLGSSYIKMSSDGEKRLSASYLECIKLESKSSTDLRMLTYFSAERGISLVTHNDYIAPLASLEDMLLCLRGKFGVHSFADLNYYKEDIYRNWKLLLTI